jgi:hypothetical protein
VPLAAVPGPLMQPLFVVDVHVQLHGQLWIEPPLILLKASSEILGSLINFNFFISIILIVKK